MKNIVILGGGFIREHLGKRLKKKGNNVRICEKNTNVFNIFD